MPRPTAVISVNYRLGGKETLSLGATGVKGLCSGWWPHDPMRSSLGECEFATDTGVGLPEGHRGTSLSKTPDFQTTVYFHF